MSNDNAVVLILDFDQRLTDGIDRFEAVDLSPAAFALMAGFPWTGMTTTVNGVPASSVTWGADPPNSLPPTIAFL